MRQSTSQSPRLSHDFSLCLDYPGHTHFLAPLVLAGTARWGSCLRACGLRAFASASPPSWFSISLTSKLRCLAALQASALSPRRPLRDCGSPKTFCDLNQLQSVLLANRWFKSQNVLGEPQSRRGRRGDKAEACSAA